jgi:nitroreductase
MLDVATRTRKPDMTEKMKQAQDLEELLTEWSKRKFNAGPDIRWARKCLNTFRRWSKNQKLQVRRPARGNRPVRPDRLDELIRSRRSIRFWKKKKVPRVFINKILEAGIWAPSAFSRLPWRFFVAEIPIKRLKDGDAGNAGMFASAPVRIFVGVDERLFFEKFSGPLDAGLAMQNMLLMAHSLGLGLIYQGEYVDPAMLEKYYRIPECCKVYCAILLGYPDEEPEAPDRMNVKEITEFVGDPVIPE